jgi:uncharacterized integral membrane protein
LWFIADHFAWHFANEVDAVKRFFWLLLAIPAAIALVTMAMANRHAVMLSLDPFRPEAPVLSIELPFFVYLFAAMLLGVVLGGIATWFNQSQHRRTAQLRTMDAMKWQAEHDRLARERDVLVSKSKQLAAPG